MAGIRTNHWRTVKSFCATLYKCANPDIFCEEEVSGSALSPVNVPTPFHEFHVNHSASSGKELLGVFRPKSEPLADESSRARFKADRAAHITQRFVASSGFRGETLTPRRYHPFKAKPEFAKRTAGTSENGSPEFACFQRNLSLTGFAHYDGSAGGRGGIALHGPVPGAGQHSRGLPGHAGPAGGRIDGGHREHRSRREQLHEGLACQGHLRRMHLRDRGQGVVRAVLREPQPVAGVLRALPALLAGLERQRDRRQGAPPALSDQAAICRCVLPVRFNESHSSNAANVLQL
ncbi:uncharacterized protein LOC119180795 [Rhipicephalus microplus]|uniref:uncharacterized protein LOC119180795 n=1 Tax=Rhipicephalus microplus TaxID=6941 RepID=UPI003F6B3757